MFDALRFLLKVRHHHRISLLPAQRRAAHTRRRLHRMKALATSIPFYRDRQQRRPDGTVYYPPFDKATYHEWDFAQRVRVHRPAEFERRLVEVLENHAETCEQSRAPIRTFEYEGRNYLGYTTSGSSGRTIMLARSEEYLETLVALQLARGSMERKSLVNAWRKYRHPPRWAVLLRGPGAFPGISLLSNRPAQARSFVDQRVYDIASLPWQKVRDEVQRFRPEILTTYPSTLVTMAQEGWELPELNLAVAMSEPFTDAMRQTVRSAFPRAMLADHYAMGECPILTTACPAGHGAHVNDDVALCTPVRADGSPCAPMEISDHVLISDLLSDVQPFLFYQVDDNIAWAPSGGPDSNAACECGSQQPRIVQILGRNDDRVVLPSGFHVGNLTLRALVTRFPAIVDYQLVYAPHEGLPGLHLNLVMQGGKAGRPVPPARLVAAGLARLIPDSIPCTASTLPALPVDRRTGKPKRFVNLLAGVPDHTLANA